MATKSSRTPRIPLLRIVAEPIRVLVVAEDKELRHRMVEQLENNGFEPTPADDAVSATGSLQEQWYDVVVFDMRMSAADASRCPGLAFLHEIVRRQRKPGVLIFGSSDSISPHLAALELGAIAYFDKAENLELLPDRVFEVWKQRPM